MGIMDAEATQAAATYLEQFATPERLDRIHRVLDQRTRALTVVIEDLYQPHNASAVVRSCECMGVQDLHIIEKGYRFRPNTDIALGAQNWIHIHRYDGHLDHPTQDCFRRLRQRGYSIAAMTLDPAAIELNQLDLSTPWALAFGTEMTGLSPEAHESADQQVGLPMAGFTQSLNVSVSVALSLGLLLQRLKASNRPWQLNGEERTALKLEWLCRSIRAGSKLVDHFMKTHFPL